MGIKVSRRSLLRAIPVASAAAAIPALAVAQGSMTPDERIDAALAEIIIALRERYPNCPIRIDDMDNLDQGCIAIITHCGNDAPGTVNQQRRRLPA